MVSFTSIGFVPPSGAWCFGHRGNARQRRFAAAALVVAMASLVVAVFTWSSARARLEVEEAARLADGARRPVPVETAAASASGLKPAERVRLNRIVRRLNTPWGSIFSSLEQEALPAVAVLSVEPDVERGAVRVQTEGPSLDELLQHADRVQQTASFSRTQLLRIDPPDAKAGPGLSRLSFDLVLSR